MPHTGFEPEPTYEGMHHPVLCGINLNQLIPIDHAARQEPALRWNVAELDFILWRMFRLAVRGPDRSNRNNDNQENNSHGTPWRRSR